MPTQAATERCFCGRVRAVTPTDSPWEFAYRCECGMFGVWSFDHTKPPPVYLAPEQTLPLEEPPES